MRSKGGFKYTILTVAAAIVAVGADVVTGVLATRGRAVVRVLFGVGEMNLGCQRIDRLI